MFILDGRVQNPDRWKALPTRKQNLTSSLNFNLKKWLLMNCYNKNFVTNLEYIVFVVVMLVGTAEDIIGSNSRETALSSAGI